MDGSLYVERGGGGRVLDLPPGSMGREYTYRRGHNHPINSYVRTQSETHIYNQKKKELLNSLYCQPKGQLPIGLRFEQNYFLTYNLSIIRGISGHPLFGKKLKVMKST